MDGDSGGAEAFCNLGKAHKIGNGKLLSGSRAEELNPSAILLLQVLNTAVQNPALRLGFWGELHFLGHIQKVRQEPMPVQSRAWGGRSNEGIQARVRALLQ